MYSRLAMAATVDVWNCRRAPTPFRAATRTRPRTPNIVTPVARVWVVVFGWE
jgi:hypothetical protein